MFLDGVLDTDHGNLDQIGVGSLDGHVDCFTFEGLTFNVGKRVHIRDEAFAPIERVDIALQTGLVERAINVALDIGGKSRDSV